MTVVTPSSFRCRRRCGEQDGKNVVACRIDVEDDAFHVTPSDLRRRISTDSTRLHAFERLADDLRPRAIGQREQRRERDEIGHREHEIG